MIHIEQLVYDQLFSKSPCQGKNVNFCRVHEQIKVLKENFAKENRLYIRGLTCSDEGIRLTFIWIKAMINILSDLCHANACISQ